MEDLESDVTGDEESLADMVAERVGIDAPKSFVIPNDDARFLAFADEIWNRRPSSSVILGSLDTFECRFDLEGVEVWASGTLILGEACRVKSIRNVHLDRLQRCDDGSLWVVPFWDVDVDKVFKRLTAIFLDRTPTPGKDKIGARKLETRPTKIL